MSIGISVRIPDIKNRMASAIRSLYSVEGKDPKLVADFDDEYYRANGGKTTFSDLITHARAGNATMTDSDGLIKWAPHNLLTYSEDFSNVVWNKSTAVTITSNATTAPDGTLTADKAIATVVTNGKQVFHSVSVPSTATVSIFAKAAEYDFVVLGIGGSANSLVWYNLSNGTIGTEQSATSNATITSVGNGWYKCSHTVLDTTGGVNSSFWVTDADSVTSYAGDGTSGIYIWGAHTYRSDLGGMVNNPDRGDSYVPTTSSAVYLPRRGHHVYNGYEFVNEGVLAESESRSNLLEYSIPDSTNWVETAAIIDEDSITAPDGQTKASLITTTGTTGFISNNTLVLSSSLSYVFSAYLKAGTAPYVRLGHFSSADNAAWFDLSSGTIETVNDANNRATIEDVGNGWYRCSLYIETGRGTATNTFIGLSDSDNSTSGTSGITCYVWGAQIEQTSGQVSSYIPTSGSSVTRAAETFTIPSANLPWPTPTYIGDELVTNGTFDTDVSGWTAGNAVVTWDSGVIRVDDTLNAGGNSAAYQNITTVIGKIYLLTVDVIDEGPTSANILGWFNGWSSSGIGNLFTLADTGNGTHQVIFTALSTTSTIALVTGGAGNTTFDNISVREINPLSVSIQMDGRMTYADTDQNIEHIYYQWQEDANNEINGYISTSTTRTGKGVFRQIDNAILDVAVTSDNYYSPDILVPYNIASRHGSTFINGAVDGIALTANTTPTALPDLSSTDLLLASDYMGTIKTFRIWDKDLGDTGIAEATAPSLEPSLSLSFDSTESSFIDLGWSE